MKTLLCPASQEKALGILARETQTPKEEVTRIYENERAKLEVGARIRTYIPALALRRVRAKLHGRQQPA